MLGHAKVVNIIGNVGDAKVKKDSPRIGEHHEGC